MDEKTISLLNEVSRSAEMGKNTVRRLLDVTDDPKMLSHLRKELATFEDVSRRSHAMLATYGKLPKEQSPAAKLSAQMGISMKTMVDRSPRNLAEMLIEGNTMGVTQLTEALKDNRGATSRSHSVCSTPRTSTRTSCTRFSEYGRIRTLKRGPRAGGGLFVCAFSLQSTKLEQKCHK